MVRFISGDIYINFFRKEFSIFKLIALIWEKNYKREMEHYI